jgi:hypothetical protein
VAKNDSEHPTAWNQDEGVGYVFWGGVKLKEMKREAKIKPNVVIQIAGRERRRGSEHGVCGLVGDSWLPDRCTVAKGGVRKSSKKS